MDELLESRKAEVSIKGKAVLVNAFYMNGKEIIITGGLIKMASVKGEGWLEGGAVGDPVDLISKLKKEKANADILTFGQMVPYSERKFDYYMEWDNYAVLSISTFENWWTKQVNDKTRNMVRRAQKKGVEAEVTVFDGALVEGISRIYNETPIRQGRAFWHYGKDIETVRKENSSYLERSEFIGAYSGDELIGFIKLVYMGEVAGMMQILSLVKERDKAPNNALMAKAVEICAEKGIKYLVYSKFTYGKKGVDPLADFKKHNGFQKMEVPRYYVPLTLKGSIGLKLGFHHELSELFPERLTAYMRQIRQGWYGWKARKAEDKVLKN